MPAACTCTPCKSSSPPPTSHAGGVQLWASWLRQAAPITLQPQGLAAARAMSTGATSLPPSKWAVVRSASGQLPVYRDIRNANSREITVIRKVLGDLHALRATIVSEFQVILAIPSAKLILLARAHTHLRGLLPTRWMPRMFGSRQGASKSRDAISAKSRSGLRARAFESGCSLVDSSDRASVKS